MTFDTAQEAFQTAPSNKTAGNYLDMAVAYETDDMAGDDTFFNAIAEVTYWLLYGRQLGEPR